MNHPTDALADAVALIGAACRFPGADHLGEFWNNLRKGTASIRRLSDQDVLKAGLPPEQLSDPRLVKASAVIDGIEWFDAPFFGITPAEAEVLDPQHRIFLETCWAALEDAGCDPHRYPGSIGVFAGANFPSYLAANLLPARAMDRAADLVPVVLANEKDYLSTRVSHKLNLRGPSFTVQSACSTSLLAIHVACQSLRNLECDVALAGGVSIDVQRNRGYFYIEGGIASPDGTCRPFDASARGTVFGNGVGVAVLKRLGDAIADRDRIIAVVIGSAVNNDGANKAGFTTPSVTGQHHVVAEALAHAGVDATAIGFVEMHGTGTIVGDPVEIRALAKAFARRGPESTRERCAIGSVKANIGHLDSAAGVAGFLKAALSLQHGQLLPQPGFERLNPAADADGVPFYVNTQLRDWPAPRSGQLRRAGVSSFGLGGTNVHLVLEEPPSDPLAPAWRPTSQDTQLLVLSAKSEQALRRRASDLANHLQSADDSLADVAFTLQVGRAEFAHRRSFVCQNASDAVSQLEAFAHSNADDPRRQPSSAPPSISPAQLTGADLRTIGEHWCSGGTVDWNTLHRGCAPRRVALPGYPFQRQRYWIEPRRQPHGQSSGVAPLPGVDDVAAHSPALTRQPSERWLYVPTWLPPAPLAAARSWPRDTVWLVLEDAIGLATAVVARIAAQYPTHRFIRVRAGQAYAARWPLEIELDPRSRTDHHRLLRELRARLGRMPDVVLQLWSIDAPTSQHALDHGFFSVLWLAQGWEIEGGGALDLRVVGRDFSRDTNGAASCPELAALLGPCQVIPQEHPDWHCQLIELESPPDSQFNAAGNQLFAEPLAAELIADQPLPHVVLRGGQRWSLGYRYRENVASNGTLIRPHGVYLITGGLGKIGRTLAGYLHEKYRARLVLVSRTGLPARDAWHDWIATHHNDDPISDVLRQLDRIDPDRLAIHAADAGDGRQLDRVLAATRDRFGGLHGVIHAAGIVEGAFGRLSELDRLNCQRQLRSKADAIATLERSLASIELDFCLIVSSLSTVVGGFGYAAYAAAQHYLDALVRRHNAQPGAAPWICVDWDAWKSPGDSGEKISIAAVSPSEVHGATSPVTLETLALDAQENIDVFERVLRPPLDLQIVVSTVDLAARAAARRPPAPLTDQRGHQRRRSDGYSAWATPMESVVAGIWRDVLGTPPDEDGNDFFSLGGDSLAGMQMISRVTDVFRLPVTIQDLFAHPTVGAFARRISELQCAQPASNITTIRRRTRPPGQLAYPLSFAQQRLWFLHQLEPASAAYHLTLALQFDGKLDLPAVSESLTRIIARHETLRTRMENHGGELRQVVGEDARSPLRFTRLTIRHPSETPELVRQVLQRELQQPFDLSRGPLLRCLAIGAEEDQYWLLAVMHHAIADAWSVGVFAGELAAHYNAVLAGRDAGLPALPIQYADWAIWQREQVDVHSSQRRYWQQRLRDLPVTNLPVDLPRPREPSFAGKVVSVELPAAVTTELEALGHAEDATLFMSLLAAIELLLAKTIGATEIVLGCPVANRHWQETEPLIGCFVNTLFLRGDVSGNPSFRQLLRRVRATTIEALAHQETPFETLVELARPARDLAINPLFQILFAMQPAPSPLEFDALAVRQVELDTIATRFDLEFHAQRNDRTIQLSVIYNVDLFLESTISPLPGRLEQLLRRVVSAPDLPTDQISAASDADQRQLRIEFNRGYRDSDSAATLPELVETQVGRVPDQIAVDAWPDRLTYSELNRRAEQWASGLRSRGVKPGDVVALAGERSADSIACLLGILKAGCAFLPLDPQWPAKRLATLLEQSTARCLASARQLDPPLARLHRDVLLAEHLNSVPSDDGGAECRTPTPRHVAYLMSTSGSTGQPKLVSVSHRAAVSLLQAFARGCGITSHDVWFSLTPMTFDISLLEILLPLTLGGRVVLPAREQAVSMPALVRAIEASSASVVQTTPTRWRMLLDEGYRPAAGVKLLCGGEALPAALAAQLLSTGCPIWNLYGPTEATIWSTAQPLDPLRPHDVSLGRPLDHTTAYVLDRSMQWLPVGAVGELYLGGRGLAEGYHGEPRLTAAHFVPHPFDAAPGSRLYRTGDRASWTSDGRLRFHGRLDDQVKVRGQRVHLAEIESTLRQLPGVRDAAVVAVLDASTTRLVAHVARDRTSGIEAAEIRRQLSEQLPLAVIPAVIRCVEQLPLTAQGKIDRTALATLEPGNEPSATDAVSPGNVWQARVAEIWCGVLGVEACAVDENFFDLGGHSLQLVELQYELERLWGIKLAILELFRYPTIAALASFLASSDERGPSRMAEPKGLANRVRKQKTALERQSEDPSK
jgi:surfactin family lipopeptide synthetase A